MKSMTKLMVVAMLLVAALVVAPVAARDETIKVSGANVFIGEENLNFTGVFEDSGITSWVHYTGEIGKSSVDKTLSVNNEGNITELAKGIPTGSYYARNATNAGSETDYINVQEPSVTLDVRLASSPLDSVDKKSVTRNTELFFRLPNNLNGLPNGKMNIEVTLPGGGVVKKVGDTSLEDIFINGTTAITGNISPTAAGTYTAQAKWPRTADFFGKGFDSNTVTFEVATKVLAITSSKDSVVRSNSFTVTIAGESREQYRVWVTPAGSTSPWMPESQTAFDDVYNPHNMLIRTNAAGTASIQFNTNSTTEARSYTINVEKVGETSTNDDVKVRVEEGAVTVTASGTGTYYIGEEITLSGTCTDGDTVYLFMTGPNLNSNGIDLINLKPVTDGTKETFTDTDVEADDTWSKKWNTAGIGLDAGSYTIYAAADPQGKNNLSGVNYGTVSVSLRSGFITATTSGATVAKGDKLTISGTAQGNPDEVFIWIFGKNYYGEPNKLEVRPADVESDDTFELELKSSDTDSLAAGQYFVIVQHPMGSKAGNAGSITWGGNTGEISGDGINNVTLTRLQAPAAATALINALDSPNIPDTYVKLTFVVDEPQLFIDPIGTKEAGSKFTITGTTNLAVGNTLIVDVTSAAFQPGEKTDASAFSGTGGSTIVEKGNGMNKWSFEVDATDFKPDEYIVTVESIEASKTATALFDMVEVTETTPPAGEVTTPPAGEVTTPPADETPAEPTTPPIPGFGALVALAGLGAVAFLVLRRK
jgi:PGF-CTERM protein